MAKRRKPFRDKVCIGQVAERKADSVRVRVYQVWRKSEQVQLEYENGGKCIMGMRDFERYWYCQDWYAYDPTA